MESLAVTAQEEKLVVCIRPAVLVEYVNVVRETLPLSLLALRVELRVCVVGPGYQAKIG